MALALVALIASLLTSRCNSIKISSINKADHSTVYRLSGGGVFGRKGRPSGAPNDSDIDSSSSSSASSSDSSSQYNNGTSSSGGNGYSSPLFSSQNNGNNNNNAGQNVNGNTSNGKEKDIKIGVVKGFWLSTRFMERFFRRFLSLFFADPDILRITSKIFATVFWCYLGLSALGTLGFDTKPLLSLLSISGLTLGFASKDILTNTFAGIFIIFTRPFKRGQIITVNNLRGRVMSIDVRYCKLQNLKDRSEILVPLSLIYGNAIIVEKDSLSSSYRDEKKGL